MLKARGYEAVRLISILTNAKLPKSASVEKSYCGTCMECFKVCPGKAPKGTNRARGCFF